MTEKTPHKRDRALGTVAQLRRTSVQGHASLARPRHVGAPLPFVQVAGGLLRLFSLCRIRARAPNDTHRLYGGRPPKTSGPETVCATGVVADEDFVG